MIPAEHRIGIQKEIESYIPILCSPIGLSRLPEPLLLELHDVMRRAVLWSKSFNADELED